MKQYRPSRRGSKKVRFSKKPLMIICAAIAAVVVTIIIVNVNSGPKEADPTSVFANNVTVQGVTVGGMTTSQAKTQLSAKIKDMMDKADVLIKVPVIHKDDGSDTNGKDSDADPSPSASKEDASASPSKSSKASSSPSDSGSMAASNSASTYTITSQDNVVQYSAAQLGISVDVDAALKQAMDYSLSGKAPRGSGDDAPIMEFSMLYTVDQTALNAALQKDSPTWTIPAQNASYTLNTVKDSDKLTTTATPEKVAGVTGSKVDITALAQNINDMVTTQSFKLVQAPVVSLQPQSNTDSLQEISVIGKYSTSYSSSPLNRSERMYNIWKISSILNGTVIDPGDTMSVNEVVGPRTDEGGWQNAPGIENGTYTDQPGGGICQVSSTLYNAALRAELKIMDRTHHTYPSTYVPLGLDATISTDAPDLKLQNNTDSPVLIGINCNVSNRTVEIVLYGVKSRDYTLKFESTPTKTIPPTADTYAADPTVPPGQVVQKMAAHTGYVVEVYKIWLKDGEEYDRKLIYTDTYKPSGAVWGYNPTTPPLQVTNPSAAPSPAATTPAATSTADAGATPTT